jgi:hypothetical protein
MHPDETAIPCFCACPATLDSVSSSVPVARDVTRVSSTASPDTAALTETRLGAGTVRVSDGGELDAGAERARLRRGEQDLQFSEASA